MYERGAFDASAAQLVTGLLMAYGLGMPATSAGMCWCASSMPLEMEHAFRLSLAGIGLNVVLTGCWWVVRPLGESVAVQFRCAGLVLATVAINLLTCLALLVGLQQQVGGLPLRRWGWTCCGSPSPEFWQRGCGILVTVVPGPQGCWACAAGVCPWPAGLACLP